MAHSTTISLMFASSGSTVATSTIPFVALIRLAMELNDRKIVRGSTSFRATLYGVCWSSSPVMDNPLQNLTTAVNTSGVFRGGGGGGGGDSGG